MAVSCAAPPETINISYEPTPVGAAGRVGLITLATDFNSEDDLRLMLPPDMRLFTTRIANANPITVENLRAMADDLPRAAKTLLPGFGVDVAIFGCTSGTAVNGSDRIAQLIRSSMPDVAVTNPLLAATLALKALKARKIAILTPYTEQVSASVAEQMVAQGFIPTKIMGFGLENDPDMTALPPKVILEGAKLVNSDDADAIFISCTAIRSAEIAQQAENILQKPVITSNQALIWHVLNMLNYPERLSGFGCIFGQKLPDLLSDQTVQPASDTHEVSS